MGWESYHRAPLRDESGTYRASIETPTCPRHYRRRRAGGRGEGPEGGRAAGYSVESRWVNRRSGHGPVLYQVGAHLVGAAPRSRLVGGWAGGLGGGDLLAIRWRGRRSLSADVPVAGCSDGVPVAPLVDQVVVSARLRSNACAMSGNPAASISSRALICGSSRRSVETRLRGTVPDVGLEVQRVGSARGRGGGIAAAPFPRAARRTRRAAFTATGSPRGDASGGSIGGVVGTGDAGAAIPVAFDTDAGGIEQHDAVGLDGSPSAVAAAEPSGNRRPVPAVLLALPGDDPAPREVPQESEPSPGKRVPEVVVEARLPTTKQEQVRAAD